MRLDLGQLALHEADVMTPVAGGEHLVAGAQARLPAIGRQTVAVAIGKRRACATSGNRVRHLRVVSSRPSRSSAATLISALPQSTPQNTSVRTVASVLGRSQSAAVLIAFPGRPRSGWCSARRKSSADR